MVIKGSTLLYYKREQDVQFPPRGQIDLQVRCAALLWALARLRLGGQQPFRWPPGMQHKMSDY